MPDREVAKDRTGPNPDLVDRDRHPLPKALDLQVLPSAVDFVPYQVIEHLAEGRRRRPVDAFENHFHTQFQQELVPLTEASLGERLTPKLEQLLRIWEMVQIERCVPAGGRPARERAALTRAFVAKAVLGLPTTVALIERLHVDGCLRRLCVAEGVRETHQSIRDY